LLDLFLIFPEWIVL